MDSAAQWQQTLQRYREKDIAAIDCDETDIEAKLLTCANGEIPAPVTAFLQGAATVNPGIIKEIASAAFIPRLRSHLACTERIAILCWPPTTWRKESRWSYLLQLRSLHEEESSYIVLHAPASARDIAAAEAVIRLKFPPSYRQFLLLANGQGIDALSIVGIHGAGPTLANWDAAVLNNWFECEKHQHEIAANWRHFQGLYDYERVMDWERGENSFGSDETILVPFAQTDEAWCFDRTRPDVNGEYPVMFWDHETREAAEYFADFSTWLIKEIIEDYRSE